MLEAENRVCQLKRYVQRISIPFGSPSFLSPSQCFEVLPVARNLFMIHSFLSANYLFTLLLSDPYQTEKQVVLV